jgi:4-phytase/acid phosphatase
MCGAIGIGSTASEIFLLEYAQGMREQHVAWGALNGANLEKLQSALTLHNTQFDLMERTPYIAARQGSMLLRAVLNALEGNAAGGPFNGPMPPSDAAFVAFVGHDTNLANLGAMMEAEWSATPQVPDRTAPASALVFELRLQASGAHDVYTYYQAQSLAQMRNKTRLTAAHPPVRKSLHLAQCSRAEPGAPCELAKFSDAMKRALVPDCVK